MKIHLEKEENEYDGPYDPELGYGLTKPIKEKIFPFFSYQHIDIDTTDFNFHRDEFDGKDRKIYFQKLKNYAITKVKDLADESHHNEHFKIYEDPSKKEIELVEKLLGIKITDQNMPVMGHFALYTSDFSATDHEQGKKIQSPRIFFLFDKDSIIHILFYDPFHEIHPPAPSTIESLKKQEKEEAQKNKNNQKK